MWTGTTNSLPPCQPNSRKQSKKSSYWPTRGKLPDKANPSKCLEDINLIRQQFPVNLISVRPATTLLLEVETNNRRFIYSPTRQPQTFQPHYLPSAWNYKTT